MKVNYSGDQPVVVVVVAPEPRICRRATPDKPIKATVVGVLTIA
jgi:hypothetical protein